MNTTKYKITNEIQQLLAIVKQNKGLNDLQAINYVAGLSYTFLTDEQKTEAFKIASKDVRG